MDGDGVSDAEDTPAASDPPAATAQSCATRRHKPKATKVDKAARVDTVRTLLLSGRTTREVEASIAKRFHISERMARNYIAEARQQIEEIMAVDRAYQIAEHVSIRRDIRRRCQNGRDMRVELEAAKDEAKLLGLYPAEKHDVRVEDVDAAIDRELARLAAARQAEDAGAPEEHPGTSAVRADGEPADAV